MVALSLLVAIHQMSNADLSTQVVLPSLLVYVKPAFDYPTPPLDLYAAVWKSGRIIWREPNDFRDALHRPEKPVHYYEATVSPDSVKNLLLQLRNWRVFNIGDSSLTEPTSESTIAIAHDGDRTARIRFTEYFFRDDNEGLFPGMTERVFGESFKAWKMIRVESLKLAPKSGTAIDRPSSSTILGWAGESLKG